MITIIRYMVNVFDSRVSRNREKTASNVVPYLVVDCKGSLFIIKLNLSFRNCNRGCDFYVSAKLTLKSPVNIRGESGR